ncbi:LPS-assembly protein [Shimia isoporae]|uniref:LPS-assembly protein LptD n=1 Tax=Shimia isoporae TaxID=647720 RepID=A0A4V6NFT0_9RHOB|nr:LPS assembly protein LptD [Shimia isoporae]TCL09590.1 LPS-assembly protein [Shimia isoporae]
MKTALRRLAFVPRNMRLLAVVLMASAASQPVLAQSAKPPQATQEENDVVLVADSVFVTGDNKLTAKGNVEALSGNRRLLADEIIYDGETDKIFVKGPIRIFEGANTVILATEAELDKDMRNGLLRSARVVLSQRTQIAGAQLDRVDGRYNVLTKTTVSSCHVCKNNEPPLWSIRASRVVHDQEAQQVYFDHARIYLRSLPVFYFPHLRMPDPTLDRARGFLIPTLRSTSRLGDGVKAPYFIPIGRSKDITLTPYLSSETRTLELRYRQAFKKGKIELNGAVSDDSLRPDDIRSYLFARGWFGLPEGYALTFDLKATSDDSYLSDYDYSGADRLNSNITVRRAKRDENTRVALLHFQSLRDDEDNKTLPTLVAVAETERRFFPASIGGELRTSAEIHGHYRESSDDVIGRDVVRANAAMLWRRNWTLRNGIRTAVTGELAFDAFRTYNDSTVSSFEFGVSPTLAAEARYPISKVGNDGATYIIEPVAQIAYTGGDDLDVANDESTRTEFDEGNLLALSRFASYDRRERGLRSAVGLNWSRIAKSDWRASFTLGQVYRDIALPDFTSSSGLDGNTSDYLIAGRFSTAKGLAVGGRTLLGTDGELSKAEARLGWTNKKLWLDASFIWLDADPAQSRPDLLAEWAIDSSYRMSRHWTGLLDWRFDAGSGETAEAGLGLEYRNECLKVELSLSRKFSTSTRVASDTSFGLSVTLLGFSVNAPDKSYDRTCG